MKDFGSSITMILVLIGLCVVLGIVSRGTDDNKDKDDIIMTLIRGFGVFIALGTGLSIIGGIIALIVLIFE